ncbi:hypothetical protein [Fusibacter sp. 3D3]|nr:hypothetical protein [Fusibacter sp. 3D3]GAU79791.1 hypothetical protein F3D3_4456 [Fusibacter sp. 3D3]
MHYKRTAEEKQNIIKILIMFAKGMGMGIVVMLVIIAFYHLF